MIQGTKARFQAVLFDLDDTLLYNDMEGTFLDHYFGLFQLG